MIGVTDDFNGIVPTEGYDGTTNWETMGWVLTEDAGVTAVGDEIGMNDPADVSEWNPSCIRIFPGTANDAGGSNASTGLRWMVCLRTSRGRRKCDCRSVCWQ